MPRVSIISKIYHPFKSRKTSLLYLEDVLYLGVKIEKCLPPPLFRF